MLRDSANDHERLYAEGILLADSTGEREDYTKMLEIVKDAGYSGYIGVEYEGDLEDPNLSGSGVYDFTVPCPNTCDDMSPLI